MAHQYSRVGFNSSVEVNEVNLSLSYGGVFLNITSQLKSYLHENGLFLDAQSAYRQYHSTETTMLRVINDLLLALDKGNEVILVLLDYSAAFDTINHEVFFKRLQDRYGIGGPVLKWFMSYFKDRSHFPEFFIIFSSFSSSFWTSGWATRPTGKALATPLDDTQAVLE